MEQQNTRSTLIGMLLIFLIIWGWQYFSMPSQAQLAEQKRLQDSTTQAQMRQDSLAKLAQNANPTPTNTPSVQAVQAVDSLGFGVLAAAALGQAQEVSLENDVFKITFSTKGGRIKQVLLKKYQKISEDAQHKETAEPLRLLEDDKNRFEYLIPTNTPKGQISTDELYFVPTLTGNSVTLRAQGANGTWLEQKYVISGDYNINYTFAYEGLGNLIKPDNRVLTLNWVNYLDKIEKNHQYERNFSSLYYKVAEKNPDYCSCTSSDTKDLSDKPIKWVSGANQFFNSALIAKESFKSAKLSTEHFDESKEDLKKLTAELKLAAESSNAVHQFQLYVGPNDFEMLRAYKVDLENVISYGNSILGTINRWVVRPIFDFLYNIVGNAGIAILLLTLLVKLLLYPISYKMLRSTAKQQALKPEIDKLKAKTKDPQAVQVETMKLYQEFGVNPFGACLPTLLQMPIWMALFRFFPATLTFRQKSFLWATDLTGIEVFVRLPFHIPFFGDHISLFAILWGISLIFFSWYSMKDMDMSNQPPAMKWMQYLMPVMFMVWFNSYAAGLSLYMMFSNFLNIGQTIGTKQFVINYDKIRQELEDYKKKPKKKSAWRERLDEAMKQQQQIQQEKNKKK